MRPKVLTKLKELNIRHMVIDEMHTVSEWGESFRPVYLEIGRLPIEANIPVVTAFTATANPDHPNIYYRVLPCLSKNHELREQDRYGDDGPDAPEEPR